MEHPYTDTGALLLCEAAVLALRRTSQFLLVEAAFAAVAWHERCGFFVFRISLLSIRVKWLVGCFMVSRDILMVFRDGVGENGGEFIELSVSSGFVFGSTLTGAARALEGFVNLRAQQAECQ